MATSRALALAIGVGALLLVAPVAGVISPEIDSGIATAQTETQINGTLGFNESTQNVSAGDVVRLAVQYDANTGSSETEVYGTQFTVEYPDEYLTLTVNRTGPYLSNGSADTLILANSTDSASGTFQFGQTRRNTDTGVSDAGEIVYLQFRVAQSAPTEADSLQSVSFSGVEISDPNSEPIATRSENTTLRINTQPTAEFTTNTTTPEVGEPIELNASVSSDSDGTVELYQWDLDGDGTYERTGKSVVISYAKVGSANVSLRVSDNDGAINQSTTTLVISKQEVALNLTANRTRASVGSTVTFITTRSDTNERVNATVTVGDISRQTGGDGQVAYEPQTVGTVEAVATKPNTSTTDYSRSSVVVDVVENLPPSANFTVTPTPADTNESIELNATLSEDPDGSITSYSWDLDNDGEFDDGDGEVITVSFGTVGEKTVQLRTSDGNASTVANQTFSVLNKPTAVELRPASKTVNTGSETTLEVVVTNADGGIAAYGYNISLSNPEVADITAASDRTGGAEKLTSQTFAANNSTIIVESGLGNTSDTGEVTIATLTVQGVVRGNTTVTIEQTEGGLASEDGNEYTVIRESNALLSIQKGPPALAGFSGRPNDVNDDGLYEDVNGDGEVRFSDAIALFLAISDGDTAVTENNDAFDFNEDKELTFGDAIRLFLEISQN